MGKGDKTRARARRKEQKRGLPGLAPVVRREPNGQRSRSKGEQKKSSADVVALTARSRLMGRDTSKDINEMRAQALGESAGRALYLVCKEPDLANELWALYAALTASEDRYARLCLGKSLNAKVARIVTEPERFEAREDDQPDLRTEDEKHRDAVNAWMHWNGLVMRLSAAEQTAIWSVVRGRVEPVIDGEVTAKGRAFVRAMERLAEQIEKWGSGAV